MNDAMEYSGDMSGSTGTQYDAGWTDWIEHDGGPCPIPEAKAGEWLAVFADGVRHSGLDAASDYFAGANGSEYDWWQWQPPNKKHRITAYRLRKPARPSHPEDAEIVGMIRKACKELTGKNATFADDDLRAIVAMAATPSPDSVLLDMAVEALQYYDNDTNVGFPNDGPWGVGSTDFGQRARSTLATIKQKLAESK